MKSRLQTWVENNPEQTRQFLLAFCIMLLLVAILTFGGGIFSIMQGWHSLDLAQDMESLSYMYGQDPSLIRECSLVGDCYDLSKTYLDGALRMFQGIKLTIFVAFLIPIILFALVALAQKGALKPEPVLYWMKGKEK
jgi:hypothetical protein